MTDRRPLSRVARGLGVALATCAAVVMARPSPLAQPRPPIAIVGARIVDGSGNEPFVGTIVVSGGRITAVGRQVEPPAEAERIDGAGRTVLPGLIDTELPAALADGGAAGRRTLGLALAAGVTTAALPDGAAPPAGSGDATTPRLLAAVTADGPGRAQALPPGVRDRRNGTVAVSLNPDARSAVALVRTELKARLALAALVRDDGTLDVTALAATGLSPLEVVTALTGGGAWALGLQSDRGLLAPSMRADLVVVTGDPSASLDALSQVERVFLGGVAVDRATLLRPPPPPAAPPTASAAPSAVAPAPATPAPAATPTRGRRGGRGAKPEKPAAATPSPSTTAETAAGETPPAVTPTPAPSSPAATAATPARASEAVVTPPAAASPATPMATSPVEAATTPAPPATAAAVTMRLREPLLDDFERGETVSAIGPGWVGSGSGEGGSATTLIMGRVVKGLRDHALLLSARMGTGREPFARAALKLDAGDRAMDVSRFRGLRFDARGEGRYRIVFVTKSVADGRYHESYFSGSPLWTPVSIPFASIGQNGAGDRVPWTGRDVVEVRFEMVRDAGRLGWLELDNVTFY